MFSQSIEADCLGTAYVTANQVPNLVYELVLGGALTSAMVPVHPDTLNSRNSLAAAYQAVGRADDAIRLFQQNLVSRVRLLGPEHPDTQASQNNLAIAYQDAGRIAEAVLLYELTLAAREGLPGPDRPGLLNPRSNLATAYRDAGRADEQSRCWSRSLTLGSGCWARTTLTP